MPSHASRALANALQRAIEHFYHLENGLSVSDFLRQPTEQARESLRLRETEDGALEIEVIAPELGRDGDLDTYCQLIEGVSHFVYLAGRARTELPATQLELELQAEIDKYVVLVLLRDPFERGRARHVHATLYERVRYLDPEGTIEGDRYRFANDLAARFVRRLEATYAHRGLMREMRAKLIRFYRMGQADKITLAQAA